MYLTRAQRQALELDFQTEFDQDHDLVVMGIDKRSSSRVRPRTPATYNQTGEDFFIELEELEKEWATQALIRFIDKLI